MQLPLLIHEPDKFSIWQQSFNAANKHIKCLQKPLIAQNLNAIRYCLVWQPPHDFFTDLPNLEVIFSIGAGVDHILRCQSLPKNVPIVRLDDVTLKNEMSEYIILQVLTQHRQMQAYRHFQHHGIWQPLNQRPANETCVGIMGLGNLGVDAALKLNALNFRVKGYAKSKKEIKGIETFCASDLNSFLQDIDILVCLLPLTHDTKGMLNKSLFNQLAKGAALINVGRGGLQVEQDIIDALDCGQLSHAYLDVFETEPLPSNHFFWSHQNITITPHIASQTWPPTAAAHVVKNIQRHEKGESMSPIYDYNAGY